MHAVLRAFDTGSRAASCMLGAVAIALAVTVMVTASGTSNITAWARDVLGWGFVVLLGGLMFIALFSWVRMQADRSAAGRRFWLETGVQAANGVTTLALTFTLLGISIGIGSLAEHDLTPETVQDVIRGMTANFSMAFMTTVIGLPVSALLRGLLVVTHARETIPGEPT